MPVSFTVTTYAMVTQTNTLCDCRCWAVGFGLLLELPSRPQESEFRCADEQERPWTQTRLASWRHHPPSVS